MIEDDIQPPSSSTASRLPASHVLLALAVMILAGAELFRIYIADTPASLVSRVAFITLCLCLVSRFALREWVMATLAALLAIALVAQGNLSDVLLALDRAAFFAAFIYLVTLLKEAAQRSRSVLVLGVFLTRQPQGKRYYSISIGSHILGVLLNFGAVSLLTPLVQRGARESAKAHPDGPSFEDLERQQISALLRGFSWMILWAPTALTQAVLFTSFPDASAAIVIPLGLAASILMILLGRVMNSAPKGHGTEQAGTEQPVFPKTAFKRFGLICLGLIVVTLALAWTAEVSAAIALILVAPIVMIFWIFVQQLSASPSGAPARSLTAYSEIFIRDTIDPARSAFVLGIAGFIGQAGAAVAPVAAFAVWLDQSSLPVWVFLAALPLLVTLGGQLAMSPIMVVVFLSAVINELPTLPADVNLIVFALGAGWALSMTASPNASATLLISALTRIAPTTLTWRWNGRYALASYAVFVILFAALAQF